jgi:hypothetical protein
VQAQPGGNEVRRQAADELRDIAQKPGDHRGDARGEFEESIRQCQFSLSPNVAMLVEYHAELTVEGNDFSMDKMIMHQKDNAALFFSTIEC